MIVNHGNREHVDSHKFLAFGDLGGRLDMKIKK